MLFSFISPLLRQSEVEATLQRINLHKVSVWLDASRGFRFRVSGVSHLLTVRRGCTQPSSSTQRGNQ